MLKLNYLFRIQTIFVISLFSRVQILGLRVKKFFFLQFSADILLLVSGSVDPHIFSNPDPASQSLADPTDSDPDLKHCYL